MLCCIVSCAWAEVPDTPPSKSPLQTPPLPAPPPPLRGPPANSYWGGGGGVVGVQTEENSWVCGPGVIRQFAPPLAPIEGGVSSACVFLATQGTSGVWALEAVMGLEVHNSTIHICMYIWVIRVFPPPTWTLVCDLGQDWGPPPYFGVGKHKKTCFGSELNGY